MQKNKKGFILIFLTAVISGFSVFINKFGVSGVNPYIFTFLKNVSVALMLSGFILLAREWRQVIKLNKKQWLLLFAIGFIGGGGAFLLFFKGLAITSAAQGSFFQKTMFIYTVILAAVFLREKISKEIIIGALLLMAGNLMALKNLNLSLNRGDLYVLAATILWAIENVISKYALKDLPSQIVAWGRMFFGALLILIFLAASGQLWVIGHLDFEHTIWIEVTSFILFGYVLTWYSGLRYVSVSTATAILLLGSPITTFLAFVQSGKISFGEIISGVLIFSGLIVILGLERVTNQLKNLRQKVHVRA